MAAADFSFFLYDEWVVLYEQLEKNRENKWAHSFCGLGVPFASLFVNLCAIFSFLRTTECLQHADGQRDMLKSVQNLLVIKNIHTFWHV